MPDDRFHDALAHSTKNVEIGRLFSKMHPRHHFFAQWYDRWMILIALLASIIVYLQAGVILSNKNSENVSLPSFILLTIVSLSVLVYGVLWADSLLAGCGIIAAVGSILALVVTISYRPLAGSGAFAI